jgi:hypothetical protein
MLGRVKGKQRDVTTAGINCGGRRKKTKSGEAGYDIWGKSISGRAIFQSCIGASECRFVHMLSHVTMQRSALTI